MTQLKFALLILLATGKIYAEGKVVYGEDNRLDIHEVKGAFWKKSAESTAAMVPKNRLVLRGGKIDIDGLSLKESINLCPGEKFEDQKNPAFCSGFLFGDNLLITAGHCATKSYCETQDWVFGMYQKIDTNDLSLPVENIYSCKKIIAKVLDRSTLEDWAIIELDRKVQGIPPATVRVEGEISTGAELVVIGHPSGLPTKVTAGGFVRKNENPNFFEANLDTFGGNSGSAVFNAQTGLVEGILVRGEHDYEFDNVEGKQCLRPTKCAMDECRGEDIQKIQPILKKLQSRGY